MFPNHVSYVTQALSVAYGPKLLAAEYFAILLPHLDDSDRGLRSDDVLVFFTVLLMKSHSPSQVQNVQGSLLLIARILCHFMLLQILEFGHHEWPVSEFMEPIAECLLLV